MDYAYLSMGAYPLEDHKLIHRILGIVRLISFDTEDSIVARARFNKPIGNCRCLEKTSSAVVDSIDQILEECGFADAKGVIVWLDYTDPKKIGEQIREFQSLLDKLAPGDIVRVTVNAHPHELIEKPSGSIISVEERRKKQFDVLRQRIREYLPSRTVADEMTAEELPRVLSASFAAAALKAFPPTHESTFRPLSVVRYADGAQMLSMTGVVVRRSEEDELIQRLDLQSWPFGSSRWDQIHKLVVPDLTIRERLFLEREVVAKDVATIVAGLGFDAASGIAIAEFIDSYKNYYRFYPTLLSAEF
ncbi:hypothetical protein C3941_07550 [Kaistia algarum]|nr:hypothetical protein [Kaistia algarum]PPE80045.1 hypothetical protein C3941_07550 [Kaistia algarum]